MNTAPRHKASTSPENEKSFLSPEELQKARALTSFVKSHMGTLGLSVKANKYGELITLLAKCLVRGVTITKLKNLNLDDMKSVELFYVPWDNVMLDSGIKINNRFLGDTTIISPTYLFEFFNIRYRE